MAFPATATLDDFNRGNEGPPPSSSWSSRPLISSGTTGGLRVTSNTARPSGTTNMYYEGWLHGASYDTARGLVECWCILGARDREFFRLWMHLQNPGVDGATDGYHLEWDYGSSGDIVSLFRTDNDASTVLGAGIALPLVAGDGLGFSHDGTTFTVFHYASTAGGDIRNWRAIDSRSDSTYTSGYLGLGMNYAGNAGSTLAIDAIGGGEAVVTPPAVTARRMLTLGVG